MALARQGVLFRGEIEDILESIFGEDKDVPKSLVDALFSLPTVVYSHRYG